MATSPLRELNARTVDSPSTLDGLVPRTAADVSGFVDEASANSMGQLRRGFVSGRFNADANMMGAEESRLRAANRNDEADLLRARINIAQGRAGTFAPAEQDVTKLGWQPGRILDYGLGSFGQGAASMVDPVAMGTAANVAGGAVGMAPHPLAKMAGNALHLGGVAAGFGYNALQNKGEFYNDAVRDPETMRNKTAQEIENTGNVHGLAAGALESLFTQSVAGRLTGRPGVKALAKLNTPARIGLDLAGQGATEVAQGMAKRAALGHLNPNRDTSGDLNDSINDFAGGVFGAGPISAGSHLARGGHERTRVVDDLSSNDVSGAKPAAAPAVSAPKNLSESLVRRAQEDKSGGAEAWRNKLLGIPPEGATDIDPHVDAQHEALTQELSARAASGDAVAKKHLDTLSAMSKDGTDWYDEGPRLAAAEHIMGDGSDHEKLMAQYERRAEGRTRVLNAQGMQTAKIGDEDVVVGAPVAPGDMGSGKTGGVKIAPDSPAMKAAVEERRAIKQHGALTAQVMSDAVPEGAKPQLKKIASELGREIAEFGGSGYKSPTPGDTARVQRIAAQMVHLYGGAGANAMVQKISATANAASAPLMKALTASVAAAKNTHAYLSQQRVSRDAAAKQLVAVIPPRAQLTLHRAGLDLTTEEGRKSLLEHAEEFFDGEDTRPTMAFNKTFGAEAVEQMRAIIGQRLEPRIEPLKQSSEDQKTASQASTGKTSDDTTDHAEEGAEWERKGADKNIEAAPGTKEYFFKGRSHSTLSLEKKGHPFVADPKTKNLPTLSRLDDVNKPAPGAAAGFNSLQRTEEVAYQAYRADMGESMGATNIRTVSAHEVLNDHNVPAATRAKLMIAYMGKDGTVDANQGYLTRIANLDQRIEAAKEPSKVGPTRSQAWHKNVKARLAAMQEERRTLVAAMAETVGMKEFDGDTTLADVANAYFSSRFLVVAEQMAEKDQLRIQPAELVAMIRRGNDDLDFSDQGKKDGSHLQMQADMNLIRFKSPRAVSKDGEAAVRASDLVRWVFANRNDKAKAKWTSGTAQAHAYRNALMEGIGALAADDHMTGLPWMVNAKGKVESFAKGFPPSLQLNGTTQAKLDHGRKKRAEEAARNPFVGPPDVEAVAREQAVEPNRDRNTDADELVDEGKEAKRVAPVKRNEALVGPREQNDVREDSARYWDAPAAPATDEVRQAAMADKGRGDKRTRVPKFATAPETVTTRTDENRVPSETERDQRGGVPTERTDLSMRNAIADAALTKIETLTPTNAFSKGSALAEGLWGAFRDGRAGAYARTEALIRALGMPMYRQEGEAGPVGGLHYAAPLAMLLTPEHVARLVATAKNGPVAQEKLDGMRAKVAQALLDAGNSEIPLHEKVKLARLLTGNEKVSALGGSLQAALRPIAAQGAAQGETMSAKAEPAAAAPAKESALMRPWRPEDGEGTELPSRSSAGLGNLVKNAVGMAKAGRALNTQTTPEAVQSQANANPNDEAVAAAKDYVAKVLGPKVKVVFEKTFDAAGEWVKADSVIKLALANGPGLLTVAHHEAMHAFFDGLVTNSPAAAKALRNTLAGADIHERLKALLHNEPAALKQLADPTERVAYAFQFWAAGALDADRPAVTLFDKFRRAMRTVLGMVRESETALDIMTAFHEGKLADESAAGRVIKGIMARQTWNEDVKRNFDKVVQTLHSVTAPSNDVLRKEVMSATARALGVAMFTNPGEAVAGKFSEGYLNARGRVGKQFSNNLYGALKGLSDRDMVDAIKYLQLSTKPEAIPYAPVAKAVKNVYGLLQRYRTYAVGAGLDLESLGDNYFPRIWDLSQLIENGGKDKFTAMLNQAKYDEKLARILAVVNANRQTKVSKAEVIDAMHRQIIDRGGVDENGMDGEQAHDDLILKPFFGSQNERNFKWLDSEDVEPFLEKDLVGAMSRYLHQGVRAAEFARRFGNGGSKLKAMLVMKDDRIMNDSGQMVPAAAHGQIAAEIVEHLKEKGVPDKEAAVILARHMADIKNSVAAHEGSLGGDISPAFRKLSSAAMAYQNLRLLPLSLFAAFGDVAALAARGPGLAGAYEAFVKGLTDVYARWKDAASDMPAARQSTLWDKIAEAAGAVDSHMFLEQMGKAHTSEFMTDFARNSNRRLFMLNGLTAWDRSMRVTATKFAVQFLEDHAGLPDKQHSARWLAELGLNAKDIPLDSNGALIWDRHVLAAEKGIGETEATAQMEKIHYAITRWVEGAVLSPNAAQRPTWGSDPRAAVMFHLKQYTYSMHHTVLKRAFNEASQGNMNPVGALAAGVPIMMASDTIKGLVQGGGSLPAWQHGLDLGDRVTMGAQRAGLAGVGQFGIDALRDPASLLGPTVEQVMKTVLHPTEALGNLHDAVPGLRMLGGLPDMSKALD